MALVFGPFFHPLLQQCRFLFCNGLLRFRRRHHIRRIVCREAKDQLARLGGSGNNDAAFRGVVGGEVKPEIGLKRLFVRPVALEALVG